MLSVQPGSRVSQVCKLGSLPPPFPREKMTPLQAPKRPECDCDYSTHCLGQGEEVKGRAGVRRGEEREDQMVFTGFLTTGLGSE